MSKAKEKIADVDLLMDPWELFQEAQPTTGAKIAAELQAEAEAEANNAAHRRRRDANKDALGQALFALERYERSQHQDPKTLARLERERDKLKAAGAKIEADYTANQRGHMMSVVRDFLNKATNIHARYEPADTTDTAFDGKTPAEMGKHWLDVRLTKTRELSAAISAPYAAAELRPVIADGVTALSKSLRQTVSAIRSPDYNERTRTFRPGKLELPQVTVHDGLGGSTTFPDATALLCEVFRDKIVDHLVKVAETEFDNSDALDSPERNRRVAALTAEIEQAEYKIEYWARECRSIGQNPTARSSNPLAILDLRRVR